MRTRSLAGRLSDVVLRDGELPAALWLVPALLMVLQMQAMAYLNGSPFPSLSAMVPAVVEWLIWAPLAPMVLWLGRRFPLGRTPRWRSALVHLGAIASASVLRGVVYGSATALLVRPMTAAEALSYLGRISVGWLPIAAVVYGAVLGAGAAAAYRERSRQEETRAALLESRLVRAELEALKAQLHPHFLFNALHTIAALVRGGRREVAVDTLAELSALLREVLRSDAPGEVPLAAELGFVGRYLGIVQLRFPDRLRVEWAIETGAEEVPVPRLILQPLVENAIRHGIAPSSRAGRLCIAASRIEDELELSVTDDGAGPGGSSDPPGTGLATVAARLRQRYGSQARVVLLPLVERGTRAIIRLPWSERPARAAVA